MFSYREFIDFLKEINEYGEKRRRKIMQSYLTSDDFYGWLFKPTQPDKKVTMDINTMMSDMYNELCKKKVIKTLVETLSYYGADQYTRSAATFLFSIVRFALDAIDERTAASVSAFERGEISRSERKDEIEVINKYSAIVAKLNDICNKIVSHDAKMIERTSGLPREIAKSILKCIPEKKFIEKFKVSTFTNIVLNELYANVNDWAEEIADVEWKPFFKELFGKENILDVATFILLEGRHRIKGMKGRSLDYVWESLTAFALEELDGADLNSRNQMVELYIKRLAKMVKNGTYDVRIDLLSLSEKRFPNLTKTIKEYKTQIEDIINSDKE